LPAHVEEEEGGGGPHAPERREGPAACPARGGERNRREGKKERNRREIKKDDRWVPPTCGSHVSKTTPKTTRMAKCEWF